VPAEFLPLLVLAAAVVALLDSTPLNDATTLYIIDCLEVDVFEAINTIDKYNLSLFESAGTSPRGQAGLGTPFSLTEASAFCADSYGGGLLPAAGAGSAQSCGPCGPRTFTRSATTF